MLMLVGDIPNMSVGRAEGVHALIALDNFDIGTDRTGYQIKNAKLTVLLQRTKHSNVSTALKPTHCQDLR